MSDSPLPRVVLARRVEFSVIALGGLFLIFGWGIGHQEWARALGWILTGIGFAIEMVYGRAAKAAKTSARGQAEEAEETARVTDDSQS